MHKFSDAFLDRESFDTEKKQVNKNYIVPHAYVHMSEICLKFKKNRIIQGKIQLHYRDVVTEKIPGRGAAANSGKCERPAACSEPAL